MQPLPIMGMRATFTFPAGIAKKMVTEPQDQFAAITYHPAGCCAFFSIYGVRDHERPETWIWFPTLSFRHEGGYDGLITPAEIRSVWD